MSHRTQPWPGPRLGAQVHDHHTTFRVWAPATASVELVIEGHAGTWRDGPGRVHTATPGLDGVHTVVLPDAPAGTLYRYRLDGRGPFPDPASRSQPFGVHGPSAVVDPHAFVWTDAAWTGLPLARTVFYELHIGTFTPEGTFAGAMARLPHLIDLGITAVLVMPVADFPGRWNWGYDGVAPFAPARCYGTPDDFRRLVDRAHALGLAVHLDVVYNHLGPDGAWQSTFSPFFYSTTHHNPWGAGLNMDGPNSEVVRAYFIDNALHWVHEYHIYGLRLDATHAITDGSPTHVLAELADAVHAAGDAIGRTVLVIAEDARNEARLIRPRADGGLGLDGVWADDFHHHMRRATAGDTDGYFADFDGTADAIAATARQGWYYTGQLSQYHDHRRGTDPSGIRLEQCVICLQNHDQVGNRAMGDRLHHTISAPAWRAASTLLLVLPETPLLFMGQEWAASSPFLYFTDHEPELGRQVTEGRRHEFARFNAFADPVVRAHIPDPQAPSTFERSRLDWSERATDPHASMLRLYRRLLELRRGFDTDALTADIRAIDANTLLVRRAWRPVEHGDAASTPLVVIVRLHGSGRVAVDAPGDDNAWHVVFTTEDDEVSVDRQPVVYDPTSFTMTFARPGAAVLRLAPAEREP